MNTMTAVLFIVLGMGYTFLILIASMVGQTLYIAKQLGWEFKEEHKNNSLSAFRDAMEYINELAQRL